MTWTRVERPPRLYPGEAAVVRVAHDEYALYNVDGRLHASTNRCPHQGGSLGDGFLEGACVHCPLHGWAFDVRTGAAAYPAQPGRIHVVGVKEEDGALWLDVPEI